MGIEILKSKYPYLTSEDEAFIKDNIEDKCSSYYFLDFLNTTKGNVRDAFELFKLDEQLRSVLFQYLIRFEVQIKSDFVEYVTNSTGSNLFWSNKDYYIFKDDVKFDLFKDKIKEAFKNLNISSNTANSYAAVYVMSFGTFISMFKNINPKYKREFIDRYTVCLKVHSYDILFKYLLCLRALRNRCAHGTHIVSKSFLNQLYQYNSIKKDEFLPDSCDCFSVFELTLRYLIKTLNCSGEALNNVKKVLRKYEEVYKKYGGKQVIGPSIIQKLSN